MLTPKQEKFAQAIVFDEMNKSDAYRFAYDTSKMTDKTVNEKASILANNDKVRARIQELQDSLVSPKIMTARERLEWLSEVIQNKEESTRDRLSASDQMNKMQGQYIQKVEADVKSDVTISIELSDE